MCLLNIVTSWEYLENNAVSEDMILDFDSLLYVMNNSIVGTLLSFLVLTQYKILLLLLCLSYSNDLVYAPRRLSIPRHTSHQWKVRTPTLWVTCSHRWWVAVDFLDSRKETMNIDPVVVMVNIYSDVYVIKTHILDITLNTPWIPGIHT